MPKASIYTNFFLEVLPTSSTILVKGFNHKTFVLKLKICTPTHAYLEYA